MIQKLVLAGLILFFTYSIAKSQIAQQRIQDVDLRCKIKTDSSRYIIYNPMDLKQITDCVRTNINFTKHTLIGVKGTSGGCSRPKVEFIVTKDYKKRQYNIEAIVYVSGLCRPLHRYKRNVLIEKIDKSYDVTFTTRKVYLNR